MSLRRRLMFALATGTGVIVLGMSAWVMHTLSAHAEGEFDAVLLGKLRALAALTDQEKGRIELDYGPGVMPEFERKERPEYFEFWLDDGTPLYRSKRVDGDLPLPALEPDVPSFLDVALPDGRAGRLVALAYTPRGPHDVLDSSSDGGSSNDGDRADGAGGSQDDRAEPAAAEPRGLILAVARARDELDARLASMLRAVLVAAGLALPIALLLVWSTLALGLRPVDAIARQVGALGSDRLAARVAVPRTPRELAPVVDQINALLARLEAAFAREQRFTGNVAHELRTPIAELKTLAEVGAKWPDDRDAVAGFFADVGDVAVRMERVVRDLLLLARCHAGVEVAEREPLDLRALVGQVWSKLAARASASAMRFELHAPAEVAIETDPSKLALVLGNLLGNAVAHARRGSLLRCTIVCDGVRDGVRFRCTVENAADPLRPGELERIAEPFWRGDEARASGEHAGLGLALVSALAALLELDVAFEQDADGTFRATLSGAAIDDSAHGVRRRSSA